MSAFKKKTIAQMLANDESTKEPKEIIHCEHLGCQNPAAVRRRMGFVLHTLCREHDEQQFQRACSDQVRAMGLDTLEKKKAYCRNLLGEIGRKQGSMDWAFSLKSDFLDGVMLDYMQIEMASAALGEDWRTEKGWRECVKNFNQGG